VASSRLIGTNLCHTPAGRLTLAEILADLRAKLRLLGELPEPVALTSGSPTELIAAAAWLAETRTDGLILPPERLSPELHRRLLDQGFSVADLSRMWLSPAMQNRPAREAQISLLTSGTTGEPKIVEHTWESLFTMAKVKRAKPTNWLLTYQAGTYAWFQMVTLWLFLPDQSLTVPADRTPLALVEAAQRGGVTAISATPTFWRILLLQSSPEDLRQLSLRQITLGGEAVDQAVLDRLQTLFPHAVVTHIYATTEVGAAIVVRDGQEGFPAGWLCGENPLDEAAAVPQLQIRDGLLWIRSPYATQADWINTGDVCEVRGNRVIILGRAESTFINVGGAKVPAHEVERVLRTHPAVLWCRVTRRKAPFVGELVAADVVFKSPAEGVSQAELTGFCAKHLAEHMVPRIWNLLDHIPATDNLKTKLD
jgi:acyl-CoA synthetase (AMP-forming)/AMP-acid ligase II